MQEWPNSPLRSLTTLPSPVAVPCSAGPSLQPMRSITNTPYSASSLYQPVMVTKTNIYLSIFPSSTQLKKPWVCRRGLPQIAARSDITVLQCCGACMRGVRRFPSGPNTVSGGHSAPAPLQTSWPERTCPSLSGGRLLRRPGPPAPSRPGHITSATAVLFVEGADRPGHV